MKHLFRKLTAIALSAFLALSTAVISPEVFADGIVTTSAEAVAAKWDVAYNRNNCTDFSVDKDNVYGSSAFSIRMDNNDYNCAVVSRAVKLEKNMDYRFTAMVKWSGFVPDPDQSSVYGAMIGLYGKTLSSSSTESEWTKLTYTFNTGDETDLSLSLQTGMPGIGSKGTVWFSNIRLEKVDGLTNNWNVLVLVLKNIDTPILKDGEEVQFRSTLTDNDVRYVADSFEYLKETIPEMTGGLWGINDIDVYGVDEALTKQLEGPETSLHFAKTDPAIVRAIDKYCSEKTYQHVFVIGDLNGCPHLWLGLYMGKTHNGLHLNYHLHCKGTDDLIEHDTPEVSGTTMTRVSVIHEMLHSVEADSLIIDPDKTCALHDYNTTYKEAYSNTKGQLQYYYYYRDYATRKLPDGRGINPQVYYRPGVYTLVTDDMTPGTGVTVTGSLPTHISTLTISDPENKIYSKGDKPAVTVEGAVEGTDYTLSYEYNDDVGIGKVIISGIGSFTGTVEKTFGYSRPEPVGNVVVTYGGAEHTFTELTALSKDKDFKKAGGAIEITINTNLTTAQTFTIPTKATSVALKAPEAHKVSIKAATLTSKGSLTVENLTLISGKKNTGLTAKTALTVRKSTVGALKAASTSISGSTVNGKITASGELTIADTQCGEDISMTSKTANITLSNSTAHKKVTSSGGITLSSGSSVSGDIKATGILIISAGCNVSGKLNIGGISIV